MNNNRRYKKKSSGNTGYYVAVLMCIAAVGLVAWSTSLSNSRLDATDDTVNVTSLSEEEAIALLGEDTDGYYPDEEGDALAVNAPANQDSTTEAGTEETAAATTTTQQAIANNAELSDEEQEEAEPTATKKQSKSEGKTHNPVKGAIMKEFSGGKLVFSETLSDWRIHQGVDISCNSDANVVSITDGVVFSVVSDDKYNTVVIVKKNDESLIYYCGLKKDVSVTKGEIVEAGQQLGEVGTIPCEIADDVHLHLEYLKNGEFVDPVKGLGLKY
ncbi:MAG: M23 family metallopeptidase [Oscillospiraceae bacterium]|nr:M23 family metallopeptidase [Oscillospiraceae bacterium]